MLIISYPQLKFHMRFRWVEAAELDSTFSKSARDSKYNRTLECDLDYLVKKTGTSPPPLLSTIGERSYPLKSLEEWSRAK